MDFYLIFKVQNRGVSQPLLKNTTDAPRGQVVCASSRSGPEHLGSRSPTDSSNVPGFGPQWQEWWTLRKVSQATKKGRKLLVFPPPLCVMDYALHMHFHIHK